MLFHISIAAHKPRHVAEVIAELWGNAKVFFFPPVTEGSWLVLADDERRSGLEIYPIDTVLREGEGDTDAYGERTGHAGYTATHAAIATQLDRDAVLAIARREGWPAKYRNRSGMFGVVELWIESRQMIEVLTPEMQSEYFASMTHANWDRVTSLAAAPAAVA
jgi:hypothetical protein